MKRTLALLVLLNFFSISHYHGQDQYISYNPVTDNDDTEILKQMLGFDGFKFQIKTSQPLHLNVLIEEYLNDSVISRFNHFATADTYPAELHPIVFPAFAKGTIDFRIYSLRKNDTTQQVYISSKKVALDKKLRIDAGTFNYEWKLANENLTDTLKLNEKTDLLYFSSAETDIQNGMSLQRFCNVPNIIKQKNSTTGGRIQHYFVLSIVLSDKVKAD